MLLLTGGWQVPRVREEDRAMSVCHDVLAEASVADPDHRSAKEIGIETLLDLWGRRASVRPYLFATGSGFRKLKLPMVWYDILNVVDTLSAYRTAVTDSRFHEMWQIILSKRSEHGFVPESIYLKSKDWDFGQKTEPSELLGSCTTPSSRDVPVTSVSPYVNFCRRLTAVLILP